MMRVVFEMDGSRAQAERWGELVIDISRGEPMAITLLRVEEGVPVPDSEMIDAIEGLLGVIPDSMTIAWPVVDKARAILMALGHLQSHDPEGD